MSLDGREDIIRILVFMVAGFFSILIHEMGHALVGRKFGAHQAQIVLHGMGGVAIFPQARFSRKQSFLVTAAGPGIQLLLGFLAIFLHRQFDLNPGVDQFLGALAYVSIFWAILNCIPVWPLDGGQMLSAILGPPKQTLVHQISIGTAVIIGIAMYTSTGSFFFPLILGLMAYQNWQQLQQSSWRG